MLKPPSLNVFTHLFISNLWCWDCVCHIRLRELETREYHGQTNQSCLCPPDVAVYHLSFLTSFSQHSFSLSAHPRPAFDCQSVRPWFLLVDWQILGEWPLFCPQSPLDIILSCTKRLAQF